MEAGATPPDEPYSDSTDFAWTEKAFEMLTKGQLHGEATDKDGIVSSRVVGPCPRCAHDLDDPQTHSAVTNMLGGEWRGLPPASLETAPVYLTVDVSCGCNKPHSGAPAGRIGCGVTFRVELPVRSVH